MVKTAHSRYPRKFLNDNMMDFPGGTWVTMRGKCKRSGVELVAIGYKYNSKKVLTFITTVGAGSTEKGENPYKMKYNDEFGNVCYRDIPRPAVLSRYFLHSNAVDVHNQMRQGNLALEECWVTTDGWFRLFTTMIGITVTDTWFVRERHEEKQIKSVEVDCGNNRRRLVEFSADLSESLLDLSRNYESSQRRPLDNINVCPEVTSTESSISSITYSSNKEKHKRVYLTDKNSKSTAQTRGKMLASQARCMWCSRINNKICKTQLMCQQCGVGFCDRSDRQCWRLHVINDGPPTKPKQKRRSQKRYRTSDIVSFAEE